jgi:hypothetical protein
MTGTWRALVNQPTFNASTMLLLTDGSVMCQNEGASDWWKLTPDQYGSYVNGTWLSLANGPNSPEYYASAVLKDGRVFVAGGEYNSGARADLLAAEIYDPVTNSWSILPNPPGWTEIGDAPCCVLPDGRVLLGSIMNTNTALYDPTSNTWTPAANKDDSSSEETWTLIYDNTILVAECNNHPRAEKYLIESNRWVSAGSTPIGSDLVQSSTASSNEIGPAILTSDGSVFAIGASGHTAIYSPGVSSTQPGSWTAGPDFPNDSDGRLMQAFDAPACLLPNGKVFCVAGPPLSSGWAGPPSSFFEFDGAALNLIPNPATYNTVSYEFRTLLLPTGQVLLSNGTRNVQMYTPDGMPDPSWLPQITGSPANVRPGHTYTLHGRQLNGLSQAVSYGDDASMATNYPLVRIRNIANNKVAYCRTHDHSTMGLQTGTVIHSTQFTVPSGIDFGPSELCVIANGISSACVSVLVNFKTWKELKWEIKENFKREIDVVYKPVSEVKDKGEVEGGVKIAVEGDPWRRLALEYPDLVRILSSLADRSDKIEKEKSEKASHFISSDERPTLGDEALRKSKGRKKETQEEH